MKQNKRNTAEVDEFDILLSHDSIKLNPRNRKKQHTASSPVLSYVGFASDFGFSIALPLVGALIAGRYIDERYHTSPKATVALLGIGLLISMTTFIRVIVKYIRGNTKKN